jgi:WD40-like Beta Propeller Repeat
MKLTRARRIALAGIWPLVAALLALITACVGDDPLPAAPTSDAGSNGAEASIATDALVASDAPPRLPTCTGAPFTAVQLVPGLSTPADDFAVTLSPDELTAYITTTPPSGGSGGLDIARARRSKTTDPFPAPIPFAPTNGAIDEASVALSNDGLNLFFGSSTATDAGVDLFQLTRIGNNDFAGARQSLGAGVNSPADDMFPWFAPTNELFFSRGAGNIYDIWRSRRTGGSFQPATLVDELAADSFTLGIALEPDGLTIFFGSSRAGSKGFDVWTSARKSIDQPFAAPALVPGSLVNTSALERPSWISPDGCRLYLISDRPSVDAGGGRDVWVATREPQ